MFIYLIIFECYCVLCSAYRNNLYTISKFDDSRTKEYKCAEYQSVRKQPLAGRNLEFQYINNLTSSLALNLDLYDDTPNDEKSNVSDPVDIFQTYLHKFLFGEHVEFEEEEKDDVKLNSYEKPPGDMKHYVSGNFMRAELFNNKSGVHLPPTEFLQRGYCELNITRDFMQTAVNAFAIFIYGNLGDIERLPADYVLRSARTISMMKIAQEKLAATWSVVRGGNHTNTITYETLEKYRPLFKYINGREMARLNLSDDRILTYIGTHADLNRHQVGVIASKYIQINKYWSEPKYLNLMYNLLCGVPMNFMRTIPVNTYLQLSHQVFYHIRACDPLQRRFYLAMMTKTQALGKSFSWNARDVSRLGLLLAEVEGSELSAINPEAMAGISAQVMLVMPPQRLQYFSELQLQHIGTKALNILAQKLKSYHDQLQLYDSGIRNMPNFLSFIFMLISISVLIDFMNNV